MRLLSRPVPLPAGLRALVRRRLGPTVTLTVAALAALAFAATPAGAVIIPGEFGVQRREKVSVNDEPLQYHGGPVLHSSDSYAIYWDPTGTYRGDWKRLIDKYFQDVGAESGSRGDVFAVDGQYTDGTGRAANQSTFRGAYTDTNAYPTTGNCSEKTSEPEPQLQPTVACLTDAQIRAELRHVISSGALPGATGPAVYYLLTPPGVIVCTDGGGSGNCSNSTSPESEHQNGICGYHSVIEPSSANPVIYAVQPWVAGDAGLFIETEDPLTTSSFTREVLACQADEEPLEEPNQLAGLNPFGNYAEGLADVIVNDLSIEQQNIVVDPLLNGWYQTSTKAEQGDMCQRSFGPPPETLPTPNKNTHAAALSDEAINGDSYYVQWAFNSVGLTSRHAFECWQGVTLEPHFTAPNPVNAGDIVGFDGTESDITLQAAKEGLPSDEPFTAPVYKWDFGDGTIVSGSGDASEFHSYKYGGTYDVTLTVTDSGGNTESFTETITVNGPSKPEEKGSGGGGSGSGATPGSSTSSTPGTTAKTPGPPPVASQAVVASSLAKITRKGLVVRYSVNQQVAGRFEVLLAASIADRIGLHLPLATGLPAGTPAQVVVGKAILVTTRGGRGTIKIQFGKITAKRLRRLGKVSLLLRLNLRNSSGATTTVLSKFDLH